LHPVVFRQGDCKNRDHLCSKSGLISTCTLAKIPNVMVAKRGMGLQVTIPISRYPVFLYEEALAFLIVVYRPL